MSWSLQDAERHLRSLELFGMRFGLERMRRLMTVLDSPQRDFRAIHVVGTNGKSSTTRMIAAILERHGIRTGSYLSPHLVSYTERIQISERDVDAGSLAAAIERSAWAAEHVNHTLADDDHVTQFELLTAAAFWELARRGVEVAVVEAGLGGRYDATNVLDAARLRAHERRPRAHALARADCDRHSGGEACRGATRARRSCSGAALQPEVLERARARAAEQECDARPRLGAASPSRSRVQGAFQERNFALARRCGRVLPARRRA